MLVRVLPSLYLWMWVLVFLLASTQASLITVQHACSFQGLSVSYTFVSLPLYMRQFTAVPLCGCISGCARLPVRMVVSPQDAGTAVSGEQDGTSHAAAAAPGAHLSFLCGYSSLDSLPLCNVGGKLSPGSPGCCP